MLTTGCLLMKRVQCEGDMWKNMSRMSRERENKLLEGRIHGIDYRMISFWEKKTIFIH